MSEFNSQLLSHLRKSNSLMVAYSGGVDSSLLVAAAHQALGDRALAVTVRSPLHTEKETQSAARLARSLGVRHQMVDLDELQHPQIQKNPKDRCYHCKKLRFRSLIKVANQLGFDELIEGSNTDDLSDYRPGMQAKNELGIRSPLLELKWDKATIRQAAKERGLENWDLPAAACLASRIPYGQALTLKRLQRVAHAEAFLKEKGFGQLRVRDHDGIARIEVGPEEIERFLKHHARLQITEKLKGFGYHHVALDLEGYQRGSLNTGIEE
jgi:uncharacterized protein